MKARLIAIILLTATLVCADQACLCASVVQAATFSEPPAESAPSPQTAMQRAALRAAMAPRPATNGQVTLVWDAGESAQTVVNYSNQTTTAVGLAGIATISGLALGSTNTFAVTNATGSSNLATATATRGTNRISQLGTITIYGADRVPGKVNWLLGSSNLVTWERLDRLGTNAGRSVFLATNGAAGPSYYYRTLAE